MEKKGEGEYNLALKELLWKRRLSLRGKALGEKAGIVGKGLIAIPRRKFES